MLCDELPERLSDYLMGTLSDEGRDALRAHVSTCAACRSEVDETDDVWQQLASLPAAQAPSSRMRARLHGAIDGFIEGAQPVQVRANHGRLSDRSAAAGRSFAAWWQWQPAGMALTGVALLTTGLVAGRAWTTPAAPPALDPQLVEVRQELREMRQMVALTLLQQQEASDRLKGVRWSEQIDEPNAAVVTALLNALATDPSVNVRLSAVEALQRFGGRDAVRRGVVMTLDAQTSPLVQVAVIDFLLEAGGSGTADLLRRVAADPRLQESVRSRATRGLERLGGRL